MLVLTIVFGKLGKMPSGGVPHPAASAVWDPPVDVLRDRLLKAAIVLLPMLIGSSLCLSVYG